MIGIVFIEVLTTLKHSTILHYIY